MPEVAIVISPAQPQPLPELVRAVSDELERQGVPASTHAAFPEPRRGLVYLFVSPRDYLSAHGPAALPETAILRRTVLLGAENPAALSPQLLERLRDAGAVFDIGQGAVSALHRHGVAARLLRPGYVESWDRFDPTAPRPIDIMFYGARSSRREAELTAAADVLARHGCVIHVSDGEPATGDTPAWLATRRWALLAQSKLVVNIHRGDSHGLQWLRAIDALHTGAVLITEPATGLAPFAAGEHLLVASRGALAHVADAALRDDARLARIRGAAYERLRSWLPFSASVAVLRAALLELVGRPLAAGMYLGVSGGQPEPDAGPRAAGGDPEIAAVHEELSEVRREIERLGTAIGSSPPGPPAPARILHRSAAWMARRAARVSVLFVAGDDPGAALATLDSVAASRLRDFEIIAVAHAGGEGGRMLRAWAHTHPRLALTLISGADGRGPGAARNLALDLARAPACLIVAPGQTLYPRCLGDLAAALHGDDAATFVYPIQADVEGELRSAGAWDPARLGENGVIHPPSLIRTVALREAGGYRDDPTSGGSVDDEIWRRFAAHGRIGRIVPQILAHAAL